jgi:N-acetylmuramoyl-L-alanine amidase
MLIFVTVACLCSTSAKAAALKQGSKGEVVKRVQTKLKNWGYYQGAIDGVYGKQTKSKWCYF